jgi:hypothetical protein
MVPAAADPEKIDRIGGGGIDRDQGGGSLVTLRLRVNVRGVDVDQFHARRIVEMKGLRNDLVPLLLSIDNHGVVADRVVHPLVPMPVHTVRLLGIAQIL